MVVKQKLIFEIYHESKPPKLVGTVESSIGEIFGSPYNGMIKPLINQNKKEQGKIIVRCEKVHTKEKKMISLKLKASDLPSIKTWWFFGGTRPFFRVFRKRQGDELLIYES